MLPLGALPGSKAYACERVEGIGDTADIVVLAPDFEGTPGILQRLRIVRLPEADDGQQVGAVGFEQRVACLAAEFHCFLPIVHRPLVVLQVIVPFAGPVPGEGAHGIGLGLRRDADGLVDEAFAGEYVQYCTGGAALPSRVLRVEGVQKGINGGGGLFGGPGGCWLGGSGCGRGGCGCGALPLRADGEG